MMNDPQATLRQMVLDHQEELVTLARELIALDTVNTGVMPTGNETLACEWMRARLVSGGLDDVAILARDPSRGNLVARLPGEREGRSRLLLLSHSDVVPVGDRALWSRDPFGGEIEDGRLYGRGAADMKGTVAAEMMALLLARRAGWKLRFPVSLAVVADEESGGAWGMGWLAENHPDRVTADLCLNEGGGGFTRLNGSLCCTIGLGEKGRYEATFTIPGRGAHASQPWFGENAFYALGRLLAAIESYVPELRADLPYFDALRPLLGAERFDEEAVTAANVDRFAEAATAVSPGLGGAVRGLSRLTIVPSILAGGVKSNSVPDAVRLVCDLRSVPGQDEAYLLAELRRIAEVAPGTTVSLTQTAHSGQSARDERVFALLADSIARVAGEPVCLLPGATTGFTDSRFARGLPLDGPPSAVGPVSLAYGCVPGAPAFAGEPRRAHGPDEWTAVDDLIAHTHFFLDMIYQVCVLGALE
jgi:acetylornithine deacetylase/succinyl-diaminopimelate desuccinylase-like protein